jgi:hypothetical protein
VERNKEGDGFARLRLGETKVGDAVDGARVTIEIGADFPIGIMEDPAALDMAENRTTRMKGTIEDWGTVYQTHCQSVSVTDYQIYPKCALDLPNDVRSE